MDGEIDPYRLVLWIADDGVKERVAVGHELDRTGERAFRRGLRRGCGGGLFLLLRLRQGVELLRSADDQLFLREVAEHPAHLPFAVAGDIELLGDLGFGECLLRVLPEEVEYLFAHVGSILE